MTKTQKYIISLAKTLGELTEYDLLRRGIPITALDALIKKGLIYKPEINGEIYKLTESA